MVADSDSNSDPNRTRVREQEAQNPPDTTVDRSNTVNGAQGKVFPPADFVPGYDLLSELGRGGMGVVYRARQRTLNREVALKTILRADAAASTVARFWAEAEVMAAVRHPHVVQVFEMGEHDGRPFIAMELVTGGSLADLVAADRRMPPRRAAELVEKIARGVAAAHDLGVVHRDLKPANILMDAAGEPKVSDFGLAKWHSTDLTRTQTVMGTPAYMAPEQAAGRAKFLGPPADVWALGVILYECVAGKRPFVGATAEVLLLQIQSAEPTTLRSHVRNVPRDLETIVAKCLTKEPGGRYATAKELADDLARFVRGEPIAARPAGRAERLVRWARRKPTAAAAYGLSALSVALALVVFVVFGFWREAEGAKNVAQGATKDADSANEKLGVANSTLQLTNGKLEAALSGEKTANQLAEQANERLRVALKGQEVANERLARFIYGQTIKAAYQAWRENKIAEARSLLARTRPELRGWEYDYVHRLCHADLVALDEGEADRAQRTVILHALWSPDGSKVLTCDAGDKPVVWSVAGTKLLQLDSTAPGGGGFAWSPDGSKILAPDFDRKGVFIWDAVTGKLLFALKGASEDIKRAAWAADGTRILTSTDRDALQPLTQVWKAATGELIAELKGHTGPITSAAFSPDGSRVLTTSEDKTARIWDTANGKQLAELKSDLTGMGLASWSPDGSKVVTAEQVDTVRVWDAVMGKPLYYLSGHKGEVVATVFSPDGKKILTAGHDRTARLWDAASGKPLTELQGHTNKLVSASFNREGSMILTGSEDGIARVWSTATGKLLNELKGHEGEILRAYFNPDGTKVLTVSADKSIRVWDTLRNPAFTELPEKFFFVFTASWNADGSKLIVGSVSKPLQLWDAASVRRLEEFEQEPVSKASWSPHGSKLLTANSRDLPTIWDMDARRPLLQLGKKPGSLTRIVWSSDGSRVLTVGQDHPPTVWDTRTGKLLIQVASDPKAKFPIHLGTLSPDGTILLTCALNTPQTWDIATGKKLKEFTGHAQGITMMEWSRDGKKIVTGDNHKTARVWDAATGKQLHLLEGHTQKITHALWSADGTKIVTAGLDGTPRVWDALTGNLLVELGNYSSAITSLAWLGNESRVMTTGLDQTLRIWDTESGAELLALPAPIHEQLLDVIANVSPDGTRIVTRGASQGSAIIYDSRPINREFIRYPVAPPPRPVHR